MDRGAWQAAVHRVAQSQTGLKRLSMHALSKQLYSLIFLIYIFILFASHLSNLFMSGVGFIFGGLAVLAMIYVFKRTSLYIKNMEAFK